MITEVSYETLQKKKTLVVDAVLSPTPRACRSCGTTVVDGNGKAIIVKNGKKETIVRFEQYNHMPLVMRLKSNAIPVKTVAPIGRLKVILSNPDIQSQIMLDIKLLLY
ncbi:transposase [Enterococcus sp. DIV1279b]|nr:transposase [Enterococcus sp. 3G6_DIV0642]STQ31454.1 ISL3 family transposase [Enterococcus casseliflavus]